MSLRVYNTLTKHKDEFTPIEPNKVKMFVCGPTVYGLSHIGHAKTYIQFDFIARYLKHKGYEVTYIQNVTDVDDKIIKRAREQGVEPQDLAAKFTLEHSRDMERLGITSVDQFVPAHDHIDAMIKQIQALIDRGYAYKLDDGWYYDVSKFSDYGKLSRRQNVEPEDSVARIDEHHQKRNPGDFALWKFKKPDEPSWDTPIGAGRPGWHIEDTAITEELFGPQYDLHGGAIDLIFPHHENEIAQIEAASGKEPMVRYWMHTGLVRVSGAKMAKSAGNFTTIRDALQSIHPKTLRFLFLSQHYRSSVEVNDATLEASTGARRRIENFMRSIKPNSVEDDSAIRLTADAKKRFFKRLDDDLDTPGAFGVLFEYIREQNRRGTPGARAQAFMQDISNLFDAFDLGVPDTSDTDIQEVIDQREALRAQKKFHEADKLRDELLNQGIQLEDTKDGVRWWRNDTPTS